jgi:hypothetical protein
MYQEANHRRATDKVHQSAQPRLMANTFNVDVPWQQEGIIFSLDRIIK